jgi:hypothetical protein
MQSSVYVQCKNAAYASARGGRARVRASSQDLLKLKSCYWQGGMMQMLPIPYNSTIVAVIDSFTTFDSQVALATGSSFLLMPLILVCIICCCCSTTLPIAREPAGLASCLRPRVRRSEASRIDRR